MISFPAYLFTVYILTALISPTTMSTLPTHKNEHHTGNFRFASSICNSTHSNVYHSRLHQERQTIFLTLSAHKTTDDKPKREQSLRVGALLSKHSRTLSTYGLHKDKLHKGRKQLFRAVHKQADQPSQRNVQDIVTAWWQSRHNRFPRAITYKPVEFSTLVMEEPTTTSKPTMWPVEEYKYIFFMSRLKKKQNILNVTFDALKRVGSVFLSPPASRGEVEVYNKSDTCFGLNYNSISDGRHGLAGEFYTTEHVCPQVSCFFNLKWRDDTMIYRAVINLHVIPDEPLDCPSVLEVSEKGVSHGCFLPITERTFCTHTPETVKSATILMELEGRDESLFRLDSARVFTRKGIKFTNNVEAQLVIWRKGASGWTGNKIKTFVTLIPKIASAVPDKVHALCYDSRDAVGGSLWPATKAGQSVSLSCPSGYTGTVTRACDHQGVWKNASYFNCARESLIEVSNLVEKMDLEAPKPKDIETVVEHVASSMMKSKPNMSGDIASIITGMTNLSKVITNTSQESDSVLVTQATLENLARMTDVLLSTDTQVWETLEAEESGDTGGGGVKDNIEVEASGTNSGTALLAAMESLTQSSLGDSNISHTPIVMENVMVKRECASGVEDIHFPHPKDTPFYGEHNQWVLKTKTTAFLSARSFQGYTDVCHAVILYDNLENKFRVGGELTKRNRMKSPEIATGIMSISLNIRHNEELLSDLHINFSLSTHYDRDAFTPQCAYLDTLAGSNMVWSSKHCQTDIGHDGNVYCHCKHLTNFAVLMRPVRDQIHHKALSIISLIGCSISILCLVMTLIAFAALWDYAKGQRSVLHVCLSLSLLLTYLLFMCGIEKTDNKAGCLVITLFLHYFLLVVFSLMLAEGIELYMKVKFAFSQTPLGWKLFAPPFVVPILIVSISVGSTWDRGYVSPQFCWLNIDSGALWSLIIPIIVVVVANFIIAFLVFRAMLSTHALVNLQRRNKTKVMLKAVCILSPLLGFTWVLGPFAVHADAIVFHYLFAICNSLQGLFIFVFHCALNKSIQDGFQLRFRIIRLRHLKSFSTGGSTATTSGTKDKHEQDNEAIEITNFGKNVDDTTTL